jgi:DnaJ-class molecular chaperone
MTEYWKGSIITTGNTVADVEKILKKLEADYWKSVCMKCNGNGCILNTETMSLQHCRECRGTGKCSTTAK